ncbi:MAG TPA: hypothetical protein VNQ56_05360 [Pseudolabrys sp.]|nr:hypothetical protein [Pseudolabrys sp.]
MRLLPIVVVGLLAQIAAVSAQSPVVPRPMPDVPGKDVRVQIAVNFFIPGPSDDSEGSRQAQENARRSLYERAARECELMKATLASECRLQSVNVSINRQFNQPLEGFAASGRFTFVITPK